MLSNKENWVVGQSQSHRPLGLLTQCCRTKASGFWLICLPHSPPRLLQNPSLERKAIWRLSKRMAFTFREQAGEDCFQVASSGPLPAELGQRVGLEAWTVGLESWMSGARCQECLFPEPVRAACFLIRSQHTGSLLSVVPPTP